MKKFLPVVICLAILTSCNHARRPSSSTEIPKQEATPEALQDKSSSYVFSKRGSGDLVDELYEELVQNDTSLKQIELDLNQFNETKTDSLDAFMQFDGKNLSFYQAANTHLANISDSILLLQIKAMIDESKSNYQKATAGTNSLLKQIDEKSIMINDLHSALKIVKATKQMEAFQKNNKPSSKPIENVVSSADQLITKEKGMIKK